MSKATGKQRVAALFIRLLLIFLFIINFAAFVGIFIITLFPDMNVMEFTSNFQYFAMWKNGTISNWGIVVLSLIGFSIVLDIIVISPIKKASFTIGKNNKVLKYFLPMMISATLLMIISLINKPGLIQIGTSESLLYKNWISFNKAKIFTINDPVTIAWYVIFGIFAMAAIGYVTNFIFFMFRILFSKTRSKVNI
ncbi:MAG: hypothetical protein H9897_00735 [Candidatus Ureaplasma intestinipullorum]|uniref:Uncharacterized protein n=1 Tax=Candidatus Ureaplasma intestinipullorum TaxID=2838770 RepID=A0A9E2NVV3_9BACT|nr:hypothetical protein [Candidatus Ureaplasma intestinipullorum]